MKKTLIAFLCTFIALPAMADNYIKFKASAIEDTINTMVPESHRASAADEYQKQMDSTTGKISVMGIYKVCAAAGFNINDTNGYNGCRLFINTIAEKSGFGSGSATQQNCKTKFNGIWTVTTDGIEQCVGKDGHKLVYHASCDGAGGDCIRDFSSLQTQEPNAREFIQAYGQQKNLQFTCWYTFDKSRWQINNPRPQDYIKCSAGGKAYEFEFDDLIQDPGKTAVESENTALCEMFGGKIVKHPDSSIEKQWQSCEVSREICNGPLHNLAIKIGHNIMYQGYCRLSRTVKETSVVGLKTLPGVDSRVFYNTGAQMRAGMAKDQTEEYLRTKFPNETYVNCDPNPKILREGFGIDPDYVMTCTVGSKQVDFIFHDLTEGADYKAESGEAKMACVIVAERVNGKNCHGLDQAACTDLDKKLKQIGRRGTDYKPEQGGCILLDTQNEELVNLGLEIAGGVALTVLTGGYGAIAVVASIATDIGFEQLNQWLRKIPYNDYQEFMEHANKCNDTDTSIENQYCAGSVLNKYFALIAGSMDNLAPEIQQRASDKLQSMMRIISDPEILTTVDLSHISVQKQSRNLASFGALGLLLLANPDKWATKADDMIKQSLKLKASADWVENLNDFLKIGAKFSVPSGKMSAEKWMELNEQLSKQGLKFVDDGYGYMNMTRMEDISDVLKADNITPTIDNAFKKTNGKFTDLSDEAGQIRIQAMKEKYDLHWENGWVKIPGNIADIMRQELGSSPAELQLWDRIRKFRLNYNGIDMGSFDDTVKSADNVQKTIVRETSASATTATKTDDVAQVAKRTPLMDEYKLSQSDMDIIRSCDITFGDARYTLERVLENPRILDDLDDDITLIKEARNAKNFINNSDMGDDAYYEILHVLKRIEDIPVSGMRTKLQRIGYDVDDIANGNLDKTLTKWGLSPYDNTRDINQQLNSVENMMDDLDTAFRPYSGGYDISDEVGDWVFAYRKEKEQVERYIDMLHQFNKVGYQPDFAHIPNDALRTLSARWDLPRNPTENDIRWRMQDIEQIFRQYGDLIDESDKLYYLRKIFQQEQDVAERYIRHITGRY